MVRIAGFYDLATSAKKNNRPEQGVRRVQRYLKRKVTKAEKEGKDT